MGVKAVEIFSTTPIPFGACRSVGTGHSPWLARLFVLALLPWRKQLTATIQQRLLPLTHLNRVNDVIDGDLLDRLADTDRLDGDSGLELGTVDAARALESEPPFHGRYPASAVNDGTCPEKQDQLRPQYS